VTPHPTRGSRSAALRAAFAALACTAAFVIGGCPAELEDRERFLGSCGDVTQTIFATRCVSAGCHNAIDLGGNLDLESPDVGARVAFVPSPNCDEVLAVPTDPSASLIFRKTARTTTCGDPMPLDDAPLSPREVWCIGEWIAGLGDHGDASAEAASDDSGSDAEPADGASDGAD
jgi:hypothetical protein